MGFSDFFKDSEKRNSAGRLMLVTGVMLSVIVSVSFFLFFRNSSTPTDMWDWAICATPSTVGLLSYVYSKLYDVKEWITDTAQKLKK